MTRVFVESLLLFLLPFLVFAIYLVARRKPAFDPDHWSKPLLWLIMAGLGLVALSFIASGIFRERQVSGYVPAHIENGKLVPGKFE